MSIAKWGTFILATLELAYLSRASLLHPRSHGFYRFFAWEGILILALLNIGVWFRDPFAWYQLISWALLFIAAFLVIDGALLLRQMGKPDPERNESPMIAFEKTTRLVTAGVYRYIRHPLYSSLLFLAWGIFFKSPAWPAALVALAVTLFLVATARNEEAEDIRYFGQAYRDYMKQTKMFVPFLF
jgi:protein-S-isoprenylcysteine O-methyltransferase Ste14